MGRAPLLVCVVAGVALAACTTADVGSQEVPVTSLAPAAETVVYAFAEAPGQDPGPFLVSVARQRTPAGDPVTAAEMLMLGLTFTETGRGLATAIPPGVEVHSVARQADGSYHVDVSTGFAADEPALPMRARLAQVVYTVTQWDSDAEVTVAVDGAAITGMLHRSQFDDLLPDIVVDVPAWGAEVPPTFTVRGSARYPEAVHYVLADWDGTVVDSGVAQPGPGEEWTGFSFETGVPPATIDPGAPDYLHHTLTVWGETADGVQTAPMECVLTLRG